MEAEVLPSVGLPVLTKLATTCHLPLVLHLLYILAAMHCTEHRFALISFHVPFSTHDDGYDQCYDDEMISGLSMGYGLYDVDDFSKCRRLALDFFFDLWRILL